MSRVNFQKWVATVNFMKAFNSITMGRDVVSNQYVCLLKRLCAEQKATVLTDKESDVFETNRKTNQGDRPIVLFTLQHRSPSGAEG